MQQTNEKREKFQVLLKQIIMWHLFIYILITNLKKKKEKQSETFLFTKKAGATANEEAVK